MEQKYLDNAKNYFSFIESTPSEVFTILEVKKILKENGFKELNESKLFNLQYNNNYFVVRDNEALIAFTLPGKTSPLHIVASHADFPCLKIKHNPTITMPFLPKRLNTELYGGMNMYSYFDRPLTLSGKIITKNEEVFYKSEEKFVIPSLAIHQDREINNGHKISAQKELLPLFSDDDMSFEERLSKECKIEKDDLLDYDLFLTNNEKSEFLSFNEYFSSPHIDNSESVWTSVEGLIKAKSNNHINMIVIFNNEETGSSSLTGALSDFLYNTIKRVFLSLNTKEEEMMALLSQSLLISADGGHAVHPGYSEKSDKTNLPRLNGGVLLKYAASGKYTTTSKTGAFIINLMKEKGIPYQIFHNNSDIPGGSTLASLSCEKVSLHSLDLGSPMLSMHSSLETGGVKDLTYLLELFTSFFSL